MNERMHDLIWQVCNVALEHGTHSDIDAAADVQAWLNAQPKPEPVPVWDFVRDWIRTEAEITARYPGSEEDGKAARWTLAWLDSLTEPPDGRGK